MSSLVMSHLWVRTVGCSLLTEFSFSNTWEVLRTPNRRHNVRLLNSHPISKMYKALLRLGLLAIQDEQSNSQSTPKRRGAPLLSPWPVLLQFLVGLWTFASLWPPLNAWEIEIGNWKVNDSSLLGLEAAQMSHWLISLSNHPSLWNSIFPSWWLSASPYIKTSFLRPTSKMISHWNTSYSRLLTASFPHSSMTWLKIRFLTQSFPLIFKLNLYSVQAILRGIRNVYSRVPITFELGALIPSLVPDLTLLEEACALNCLLITTLLLNHSFYS